MSAAAPSSSIILVIIIPLVAVIISVGSFLIYYYYRKRKNKVCLSPVDIKKIQVLEISHSTTIQILNSDQPSGQPSLKPSENLARNQYEIKLPIETDKINNLNNNEDDNNVFATNCASVDLVSDQLSFVESSGVINHRVKKNKEDHLKLIRDSVSHVAIHHNNGMDEEETKEAYDDFASQNSSPTKIPKTKEERLRAVKEIAHNLVHSSSHLHEEKSNNPDDAFSKTHSDAHLVNFLNSGTVHEVKTKSSSSRLKFIKESIKSNSHLTKVSHDI